MSSINNISVNVLKDEQLTMEELGISRVPSSKQTKKQIGRASCRERV